MANAQKVDPIMFVRAVQDHQCYLDQHQMSPSQNNFVFT